MEPKDIKHNEIDNLIAQLGLEDGLSRQKARRELVVIGKDAVAPLITALTHPNHFVRWEAAEALGQIGDPSAAGPLVTTLRDENMDVRGASVLSLVRLHRWAVKPLLEALVEDFDSVWLRDGAYQVLHSLQQQSYLTPEETKILAAIKGVAPEVETAWAADAALQALNHHTTE